MSEFIAPQKPEGPNVVGAPVLAAEPPEVAATAPAASGRHGGLQPIARRQPLNLRQLERIYEAWERGF